MLRGACLERQGITDVGVASTSAEALRYLDELRPDVTLVDVDLRGERLRTRRATPAAWGPTPSPVILISFLAAQDFVDMIETSPAVGFLSKSA